MSVFISKETISRLLKDVKQIIKNPLTDNGIYYIHDDTNMMKGYALIIGPEDTPYFGGYYFFELYFSHDYPHSPPSVKYWTNYNNIRFNPNLYTCGKVCVSLLNTWRGDQWTSCQTISTVLLTLCTLLCKDPLLNEPGVCIGHSDIKPYDEIIQYANLDIAVCNVIMKKEQFFLPFFNYFFPFIKERFIVNFDKLIEFAEKKNVEFNCETKDFKTSYYAMEISVDYNKIIDKLKQARTVIA
jgi:ubiquitin-conjugating enzyme E2 Z